MQLTHVDRREEPAQDCGGFFGFGPRVAHTFSLDCDAHEDEQTSEADIIPAYGGTDPRAINCPVAGIFGYFGPVGLGTD